MMNKSYSELIKLESFEDRFNYLKTNSRIGDETFGYSRFLNQEFYKSKKYRHVRDMAIIRDMGCDLGILDRPIKGEPCILHHINEISIDDIINDSPILYDLENMITTRSSTHKAIHFGDIDLLPNSPIEREVNDTCPWKKKQQ